MPDEHNPESSEQREIEFRLGRIHQYYLRRAAAVQRAGPHCPPRARIAAGALDPAEQRHVAACADCRTAMVAMPQKTLIAVLRPRLIIPAAIAAAVLLFVAYQLHSKQKIEEAWREDVNTLRKVGPATGIAMAVTNVAFQERYGMEMAARLAQNGKDLTVILGPAHLRDLGKLDREMSSLVDGPTMEQFGLLRLDLARVVKPSALVEMERMKLREAATVPSAFLVQLERLKLAKAQLVSSKQLLELESKKEELLKKVPPDSVVDLERLNVSVGQRAGRQALAFLVAKQLDWADHLDGPALVEHARKTVEVGQVASPAQLKEMAILDFKSAYLRKQSADRRSARRPAVSTIAKK